MAFLSSVWSFLSLVTIAWITQRIIQYWDRKKKIAEVKLNIYLSWLPFLAECYASAVYPDEKPYDKQAFLKRKLEILGTLQIMGPGEAMLPFILFCELAEAGFRKDKDFDQEIFHKSFTDLNYCLCCEIHAEKHNKSSVLDEIVKKEDNADQS